MQGLNLFAAPSVRTKDAHPSVIEFVLSLHERAPPDLIYVVGRGCRRRRLSSARQSAAGVAASSGEIMPRLRPTGASADDDGAAAAAENPSYSGKNINEWAKRSMHLFSAHDFDQGSIVLCWSGNWLVLGVGDTHLKLK